MQRGDALTADMLDEFHGFVHPKSAEPHVILNIAPGSWSMPDCLQEPVDVPHPTFAARPH
jgi:hypothetical protein